MRMLPMTNIPLSGLLKGLCLSALLLGATGSSFADPDSASQQSSAAQSPAHQGRRIVNRVAAMVNGRPITANEVTFLMLPIASQLAAQFPRQGLEFQRQLAKAKHDIINDLIERELVLSDFETKGYQIPDSAVDREVARTIRENFNGNRDKFLENLRQSNMTIRGFREKAKENITVMAMRSSKYDQDIPPTPDEIRKEYEATKYQYRDITKDKVKFKKIFIPLQGDDVASTPEVQLELADLISKEIKSGNSTFAEMAQRYSRDQMAEKGGDWPIIERSELSPEFAAIIFEAPENTIVGPMIDPNGFTIVSVEKKILATPPSLAQVKEQVDAQVRSKRSHERYKQWIERLRKKAIIKKYI